MKIHMIGNAHLDPAWMWDVGEGMQAFIATCASALDRIDEFDEFIFTCSSAALYAFLEEAAPELFLRVKAAVASGRWEIVGGWWVESDCNLPSGESLLRQALVGQRYFRSRFGKMCLVGFSPDAFGHTASLPQLLRHSGLLCYVFMRPEAYEQAIKNNRFYWRARDGSSVDTYRIPLHYSNFRHSSTDKLSLLSERSDYAMIDDWMLFYGVGNHGGGPTIEQIRQIQLAQAENANVRFSTTENFFASNSAGIAWSGELYPHAIGCYGAHAQIKRLNRLAETVLLRVERLQVMHYLTSGERRKSLARQWEKFLFNHFHDIICGVATKEVLDQAIYRFGAVLDAAASESRMLTQRVAATLDTNWCSGEALVIINHSAFEFTGLITCELWHPHASERGDVLTSLEVLTKDWQAVPTQLVPSSGKIGNDRVAFVVQLQLPPFSARVLDVVRNGKAGTLRNQVTIETVPPPALVFSDHSDTWGHGVTSFSEQAGVFEVTKQSELFNGPLMSRHKIESKFGSSRLEQIITKSCGSDFLRIDHRVRWAEQDKLLKFRVDHLLGDAAVLYEIPHGTISRSADGKEYPGQSWLKIEKEGKGVAIVTDSNYSYSATSGAVFITVLRSPLYAHHAPPHEISEHEDCHYMDQGEHEFTIWIRHYTGEMTEGEIRRQASMLLDPPIAHLERAHSGSSVELDFDCSPDIHIAAMKLAEDGEGLILRAFETAGQDVTAALQLGAAKWESAFPAYALKSFHIQNGSVAEVNGLELPI